MMASSCRLSLYFFLIIQFSKAETSKYLQFSNQREAILDEATNYAILKSGTLNELPSSRFTICSSIYVAFFRGYQSFYTVRKNDHDTLWFSLNFENQYLTEGIYKSVIFYYGGSVFSNTDGQLRLKPHAWSHACTTVDVESGHVMVVINGILTHNMTINSKDFTDNVPTVFKRNLILGISQRKFPGTVNSNYQSEASVSNVNVFSVPLSMSKMLDVTYSGKFLKGDVVSWTEGVYEIVGNVKAVINAESLVESNLSNLFKMGDGLPSWNECMNLCPRVQASGRVPFTRNSFDAEQLANLYSNPKSKDYFWAPFRYQPKETFTDHYTRMPMPEDIWAPSQPNDGEKSTLCTLWVGNSLDGRLFDAGCTFVSPKMQCLCHFDKNPILRMRGICKDSKIETHFSLKVLEGSIGFIGLTHTVIRFLPTSTVPKWTITVNLENITATTSSEETSFVLGRNTWNIGADSPKCHKGEPYSTQLKLSGCNTTEGEFTCDDGQCVSMEQRCDQIADCKDKSDEKVCEMLVPEEGYNKRVPPFTVNSTGRKIVPVQLNISIDLLKIVDMEETDHKIDFQFQITLEWRESDRVVYHNLKQDTSLNTLSDDKY